MAIENTALILQFVEWIGLKPRSYEEVMEAWRTSCPRLTVWEDAVGLGLVERSNEESGAVLRISEAGRIFLSTNGAGT